MTQMYFDEETQMAYSVDSKGTKYYYRPGTNKYLYKEEYDGTRTYYRADGKTIDFVENREKGTKIEYYDGKIKKYEKTEDGKEIWYRRNGTKERMYYNQEEAYFDEKEKLIRRETPNGTYNYTYSKGYQICQESGYERYSIAMQEGKGNRYSFHSDKREVSEAYTNGYEVRFGWSTYKCYKAPLCMEFDGKTKKLENVIYNDADTGARVELLFNDKGGLRGIVIDDGLLDVKDGKIVGKPELVKKAKEYVNKVIPMVNKNAGQMRRVVNQVEADIKQINKDLGYQLVIPYKDDDVAENRDATRAGMKAATASARMGNSSEAKNYSAMVTQQRFIERTDASDKEKSAPTNEHTVTPVVKDNGHSLG